MDPGTIDQGFTVFTNLNKKSVNFRHHEKIITSVPQKNVARSQTAQNIKMVKIKYLWNKENAHHEYKEIYLQNKNITSRMLSSGM
jgi:hypothetical protein